MRVVLILLVITLSFNLDAAPDLTALLPYDYEQLLKIFKKHIVFKGNWADLNCNNSRDSYELIHDLNYFTGIDDADRLYFTADNFHYLPADKQAALEKEFTDAKNGGYIPAGALLEYISFIRSIADFSSTGKTSDSFIFLKKLEQATNELAALKTDYELLQKEFSEYKLAIEKKSTSIEGLLKEKEQSIAKIAEEKNAAVRERNLIMLSNAMVKNMLDDVKQEANRAKDEEKKARENLENIKKDAGSAIRDIIAKAKEAIISAAEKEVSEIKAEAEKKAGELLADLEKKSSKKKAEAQASADAVRKDAESQTEAVMKKARSEAVQLDKIEIKF